MTEFVQNMAGFVLNIYVLALEFGTDCLALLTRLLSHPLLQLSLWRRQAQTARNDAISYRIEYVAHV